MLTRPEVRPAPRYKITGNEHRGDDVGSSSLILKAYEEAQGRPLSTTSRREVYQQVENIRATSAPIHQLA